MFKSSATVTANARFLTEAGLAEYLSLGRSKAREIGASSGARVKVGRRVLYERSRIDSFFDHLLEEEVNV